ncbi:MAG: PEP-CTERM sorting domain-containing protein [Opitutales bacterium]|nr:PEP-CTERM sorting domain-containing protein [Opitutales bacterium]
MKKLALLCLPGLLTAFAGAQSLSVDFNPGDFVTGPISGQGSFTSGGGQVISDPMDPFGNQFLTMGAAGFGTGAVYTMPAGFGVPQSFSMDFSIDVHPTANTFGPVEFFVQFNGWNNFIAMKWDERSDVAGTVSLEARVSGDVSPVVDDGFTIAFNQMHTLDFVLNASGTAGTFSLNGTELVTLTSLGTMDWTAGPSIQFLHQRANVTIDSFSATAIPEPSTYALLFGTLFLGLAGWRRFRR